MLCTPINRYLQSSGLKGYDQICVIINLHVTPFFLKDLPRKDQSDHGLQIIFCTTEMQVDSGSHYVPVQATAIGGGHGLKVAAWRTAFPNGIIRTMFPVDWGVHLHVH